MTLHRLFNAHGVQHQNVLWRWIERYFKAGDESDNEYNNDLLSFWLLLQHCRRAQTAANRWGAAMTIVDVGASRLTNPSIVFSTAQLSTESGHSLSATPPPPDLHWEGNRRRREEGAASVWSGEGSMGLEGVRRVEEMKVCEKPCRFCNGGPWIESEWTSKVP